MNIEAITKLAAHWRSEQSLAISSCDVDRARKAEECAMRYEKLIEAEKKKREHSDRKTSVHN